MTTVQRSVRLAGMLLALSAGALLSLTSALGAQERQVPLNRAQMQLSFAPVVKSAAPAVVNVYVTSRVRTFTSPFADHPIFSRLFRDDPFFGAPRERMQNSLGSGVIVSPDGLVVTNNHVIKGGGSAEIKVSLADKREFDARVILRDVSTDLAVLQIDGAEDEFPYLEFVDSDTIQVGDLVLAIGNPFGVGQTVTSGIVSALARTKVGQSDNQFFIQTDAAINPGNSGGALIDMNGRLIGINTAIFSRSGGSNGIGFAIPSNMVRLVASSATGEGAVKRPWFGAELEPVTRDIADALGLERVSGALVASIYDESAAADAGIRPGDVITSVDGRRVDDPRAFNYRFTTRGIGGEVEIGVVRNGRRLAVPVTLREAPENAGQGEAFDLSGNHPPRRHPRRQPDARHRAPAPLASTRRRRHHRGQPRFYRSQLWRARRRHRLER